MTGEQVSETKYTHRWMRQLQSIAIHPEIQDGAPVFCGTSIRIETFYDFTRIGVSINEFLREFPSLTRDQVNDVYELMQLQLTPDHIREIMLASIGRSLPIEARQITAAA